MKHVKVLIVNAWKEALNHMLALMTHVNQSRMRYVVNNCNLPQF